MKRQLSLFLTSLLLTGIFTIIPINAKASGNTWDPANGVYEISTEDDLFAFKDSLWDAVVDKTYYTGITVDLKEDIELTRDWDTLSVTGDAEFRGVFNGNNHTISNINCKSQDNYCGFFPALYNSTIRDLTLSDFTLSDGKYSSAAFTSYSYGDVTISNCHLTGQSLIERSNDYTGYLSVSSAFVSILNEGKLTIENSSVGESVKIKGDIVGGFIGYNSASEAKIYSCVNNGTVCDSDVANYVGLGGFIGYADQESNAIIDRSVNHGDVYSNSHSGFIGIGGFGGCVFTSAITNCFNTGEIFTHEAIPGIGGIVGVMRSDDGTKNNGSIINCYNVGKITGENFEADGSAGGIAGSLTCDEEVENEIVVENCHNFSEVNGDNSSVGQLIGWYLYSTINNSYSTDGKPSIGKIELSNTTSKVGYFSSADIDGKITYADINLADGNKVETRSAQTNENVLSVLNQWVSDKNAELEASGSEFRYLTWKMTNPASEDGSKGVTVHPMFGVEELKTVKFHTNQPGETEDKLFRVYNAEDGSNYTTEDGLHDLVNYRVPKFYEIPSFAGDEYVFAGWYYNTTDGTADGDEPFEFDSALPANVTDVYAHWIPVGTVAKDADDDKVLPDGASYSGFGLFGVQIRPEYHYDSNYGEGKPGGLRFVASVGEELLGKIDRLSEKTVNGNKVEYGFVTAAESTVNTVIEKFNEEIPGLIDSSKYKLQYNGENVNGVKTTVRGYNAENFNYVTNVDCTSKVKGYSTAGVKEDHRNFDGYRLATYVVTYDDDETGENKTKNVVARAYMRYYDANGLLRTFYNDYSGTNKYGGCSISYNRAEELSATNKQTVKN